MEKQDSVLSILELKYHTENVFFKNFFCCVSAKKSMSHSQIMALIILELSGSMCMSDLSKKLNLEKGSFTPVAKQLVEKAYIVKQRDESDKRSFMLALTKEGRQEAQNYMEEHRSFISSILKNFSEEERKRYLDAVSIVSEMTKVLDTMNE